jgi:hypothetical protein
MAEKKEAKVKDLADTVKGVT